LELSSGPSWPGAPFSVIAAVKQADGSFDVNCINVGRDGASPP